MRLTGAEHVCTFKYGKVSSCRCLVGHDHAAADYEWRPGVLSALVLIVAAIVAVALL